ncbi:Nn.00g025460.m01.CDS01 [Neocucurbitaria sp. VM-36]
MSSVENNDGLSECIGRAIQEHLTRSDLNVAWPQIDNLNRPILRIEAFLEEAGPNDGSQPRSERVASRTLDLAGMVTPAPSRSLTAARADYELVLPTEQSPSRCSPEPNEEQISNDLEMPHTSRRKGTGGLRISQNQSIREDLSEHQRQMQIDSRNFPKRKKIVSDKFVFQPSTLDKLIIGIWEQVHGSIDLDPKAIFEQFQIAPIDSTDLVYHAQADMLGKDVLSTAANARHHSFSQMNVFCRKVTQASRVCRSIEMIVQARWTELFEVQVQLRIVTMPEQSATKHRKAVFMEACQDFGWSEKELRNKMAIWRGYKEVKDAAGWAALVFAGMGIYRFCKYRVGFDKEAMRRLRNLQKRLEVAADTLHPHWRQLLAIVGESQTPRYPGHPHEWVICEDGAEPIPLRQTYHVQDPYFAFEHIEESVVDESVWGCDDPRWMPQSDAVARPSGVYTCALCGERQSDDAKVNACFCFPALFGCAKRRPAAVQVYRTPDGRNNGLVALTSFERGTAIGELVGLITKGVRHLDVMHSSTPLASYQICQRRMGNYTRFVNHSCKANAQSSTFTWLDTQRVIVVSKGVEAGSEITVDYGNKYWAGLDKACLCGEACCRYPRN